jgi:hypothetical protein
MSDIPILGQRAPSPPTPTVEVVRSFSWKLNVGNYESRDFFCSQKAECPASEAAEVSEHLHAFCKSQVLKALNQYLKEAESNFGPEKRRA